MRKRSPIYLIGALLLFVELMGCASIPAVPQSVSVNQIPAAIRGLRYAHFSLGQMAFFKDRLYVSSNIGLLVLNGTQVETLYTWYPQANVVSGPWVDVANDALWTYFPNDNWFRRFDGTSWRAVRAPLYSRSSSITIYRGISSPTAFRLLVGGHLWRFKLGDPSWVLEPRPPAPQGSETEAVAPLGPTMLHIVRETSNIILPNRYAVYDRENNWARQGLSEKMDFPYEGGGLVTTAEGAYLRARDGRIFLIGSKMVQVLETPGRCEALALTSTGQLLASFVDRGIFLLDKGRWEIKAAYPYGPQEGKHWAFLAESDGQIAYATTSLGNITATTALWVLRAGKLERVTLN